MGDLRVQLWENELRVITVITGEGAGVLILQLSPIRGSELMPVVWGVNSLAHWPVLLHGLSRLHWSEKNLAQRLVGVCS